MKKKNHCTSLNSKLNQYISKNLQIKRHHVCVRVNWKQHSEKAYKNRYQFRHCVSMVLCGQKKSWQSYSCIQGSPWLWGLLSLSLSLSLSVFVRVCARTFVFPLLSFINYICRLDGIHFNLILLPQKKASIGKSITGTSLDLKLRG